METLNTYIQESLLGNGSEELIKHPPGAILWESIKTDFYLYDNHRGEIELSAEPTVSSDGILKLDLSLPTVYLNLYWDIQNLEKYESLNGIMIVTRSDYLFLKGDFGFKKNFTIQNNFSEIKITEDVKSLTNVGIETSQIILPKIPKTFQNVQFILSKDGPSRYGFTKLVWDEKLISELQIRGDFRIQLTTNTVRNIPSYLFGGVIELAGQKRKTWQEIFDIVVEDWRARHPGNRNLPAYTHYYNMKTEDSNKLKQAVQNQMKTKFKNWVGTNYIEFRSSRTDLRKLKSEQDRHKSVVIVFNNQKDKRCFIETDTKMWEITIYV